MVKQHCCNQTTKIILNVYDSIEHYFTSSVDKWCWEDIISEFFKTLKMSIF